MWDRLHAVSSKATDNWYLIAGETSSFGAGYDDFWILRLNSESKVAFSQQSGAVVLDTTAVAGQTTVSGQATSVVPVDTYVIPQTTQALAENTACQVELQSQ